MTKRKKTHKNTPPVLVAPPINRAAADPSASGKLGMSPLAVVIAGAFALVAIWSYWPNIVEMVNLWENEPDYSHGFLVLPIALAILWLRKERFPAPPHEPAVLAGSAFVIGAMVVRYLAGTYFYGPIDTWSLLIWIMGVVLAVAGWRVWRWALPSIIFLVFAMPMPYRVETMLRQPLQRLVTKISSALLIVVGEPAIAEGNVIRIADQVYGVDEACAGLRIFLGIAAFGFLLAAISHRTWFFRILILAGIVPVALFANLCRIVVTCLLFRYVGSEAAKTFAHDAAGIVMVPFAAVLFCLYVWILGQIFAERDKIAAKDVFRQMATDGVSH